MAPPANSTIKKDKWFSLDLVEEGSSLHLTDTRVIRDDSEDPGSSIESLPVLAKGAGLREIRIVDDAIFPAKALEAVA